jgi:hypothetical protein
MRYMLWRDDSQLCRVLTNRGVILAVGFYGELAAIPPPDLQANDSQPSLDSIGEVVL